MRLRCSALLFVLACTPNVPEKKAPQGKVLDALSLPTGESIVVETIGDAAAASPEALRQYLYSKAQIDSRLAIDDGFAATLADERGRETHVLRERRNHWFDCHAKVTDDAMRDAVIALCKSWKPATP